MANLHPIRILHVVGAMNRAGTETMLMNIYRNINRDKVQFDFISYSKQDAHYDEEIIRMGGRVIKLTRTQSIKQIYDAIKRYGPYHVVHAHTLFHCGIANLAAKLAGVKIRISHAHTTTDQSDNFLRKIYINSMRLLIIAFSTNLLSCSKAAGRYLFGEKNLYKPKYTYFPNLIDYLGFLEVKEEEVLNFRALEGLENKIVIGHIGRFMLAKNHIFLLDVFESLLKKNNNAKLVLVGDGELKARIEAIAKQKGILNEIRFVGLRYDISTLLHSLDVFVFPSLYEGLGIVLLEAQASGIPCVVSEAIQPEADLNIKLVEHLMLAADADTWAERVLELVGKKQSDKNKIINAFEENGYSLSVGIAKLMTLYNLALEDA